MIFIFLHSMPNLLHSLCSSESFSRMLHLLYKSQTDQQTPAPPASFLDLEKGIDRPDESTTLGLKPNSHHHHRLSWEKTVVTFCLTSTIEVALFSAQKGPHHLPTLIHLFNISVFFAFCSLFVSKFINPKFWIIGRMLDRISILFVSAAFVLATTAPYPLWLTYSTWAIYAISLLTIFISRCF